MTEKTKKSFYRFLTAGFVVITFVALMLLVQLCFADGYEASLQNLLDKFTDLIGVIFRAVGIILLVFAIGQLIMAFKDENPDGKTRGTTLLVVAVVLICMPNIIDGFSSLLKL